MAIPIETRAEVPASLLAAEGRLIWLLEDSPLDVEHTRKALGSATVRVFNDGPTLLEEFSKGSLPDALVLDWELGDGVSGIEVCRFVRRTQDRFTLPVIMLTSHSDKARLVEALAAGANDYVTKPFHAAELFERVGATIRTRRLFAQLVETNAALERERARVQESEEKYRRLADSGIIGVVETDLQGVLLDANDAFLSLVGRTRAELASGKLSHVPECRPLDERALRELVETGVTSPYEKEFQRADGQTVMARIAVARLGRHSMRCVGYVLDVTHERSVEADRARLFEDERRARADAELASRMKDEFLAIVSHELRTPMNSIVGWAEILRRGSNLSPQLAKAVDVIHRNARAQAKMIEDILDVSRIITGKVRLEPRLVDLISVIDLALDAVRPTAEAKHITLENTHEEPAISLVGDGDRLQQVIWNLLSNAVKFTPSGGRVTVSARVEDGRAIVEVSDTGAGIAPEHLLAIFERFRQIDPSPTRSHGGLGLGLAIVRHLVELHGGTVRATSEGLGRGTTFTLRFPLQSALRVQPQVPESGRSDPPESEEQTELPSLGGLQVLLVDDEKDSRALAAMLMRSAGAEVHDYGSAGEALAAFASLTPDVLVTDIAMPRMDGFELLRRIRALPGGDLPAIAVTAYAREEDAARAREAGFSEHVKKPYAAAVLLSAVLGAAEKATSQRV